MSNKADECPRWPETFSGGLAAGEFTLIAGYTRHSFRRIDIALSLMRAEPVLGPLELMCVKRRDEGTETAG